MQLLKGPLTPGIGSEVWASDKPDRGVRRPSEKCRINGTQGSSNALCAEARKNKNQMWESIEMLTWVLDGYIDPPDACAQSRVIARCRVDPCQGSGHLMLRRGVFSRVRIHERELN